MAFDPKSVLTTAPEAPGVYRMLDAHGLVLYVGKARELRKRLAYYFRSAPLGPRLAAMVRQVADVQVTVTRTEGEALLLENNLIKELKPRYNILLRDDKSYPYIFLTTEQPFPRIGFYRGARREKGRYFGPFPSASAVRESLNLLQKVFPVRQCEDGFYRNRTRPCLQYQIKRCSAPCVGLVSREAYAEDVRHAVMFLEGQGQALIDALVAHMEEAAAARDYERAALFRDRIAVLRRVQERQYVSVGGGDADVLAAVAGDGGACVEVTMIRDGRHLGGKTLFPVVAGERSAREVLAAFVPQYYLGKAAPHAIYLNHPIPDQRLLQETLAREAGHRVTLSVPARGARRQWVKMAEINAEQALRRHAARRETAVRRLEALREALQLDAAPERVECFDVSHTQGEATVASCVVFGPEGPIKSDYRRFNVHGVAPGDDYAALTQALTRRYRRVQAGEGKLPDLLLIDGGKGQRACAEAVLQELHVTGVKLVAVAKGPERKPGREQLFLSDSGVPTILPADSPALHVIQQIRDEAHRFAITGHRQRRARSRVTSTLEEIPGIGAKRRQALLRNLGGLRSVARAGIEELSRVPGISPELARRIYEVFHQRGD